MRIRSLSPLAFFAVLLAATLACDLNTLGPTPTPTSVFGAVEATQSVPTAVTQAVTTAAPQPTSSNGTTGNNHCLEHPSEASRQGPPCLQGSYDAPYDVNTHVSDHEFHEVINRLTAQVSLWAVQPGALEGTAHLTYSLYATYIDRQATCQVQTEIVKPFEWDVQLSGTYFQMSDGSVRVITTAVPNRGPTYTAKFIACNVPDSQQPGITWPAFSGRLVNGVYDFRSNPPLPENSTGEFYTVTHIEEAQP